MNNLKTNIFFWILMALVLVGAVGGNTIDFLRFRSTTLPSTGKSGEVRLDSSTQKLKKWNSTSAGWDEIAGISGVVGIANGGTNNGSLGVDAGGLVYTDGSKLVNTGAGTFDQIATSNGSGAPLWAPRPGLNIQRDYITGGHFENSAASFAAYADAAAATPADGTGGSPNSSVAITTTAGEVLNGSTSLEFVKGGANRQGEGFSRDFTIDYLEHTNLRCQVITFNYKATSNYPNGAIKLFVYDKDAAAVLSVQDAANLSGALVPSTTGTTYTGHFCPTTSTSNDYRLIFHVVGTETTAWDFHLDNLTVGPGNQVASNILADLGTESWTDSQANSTTSCALLRDGPRLKAKCRATFTGAMSGAFTLTIPAAYAPSSKYDFTQGRYDLGPALLRDSGTAIAHGRVVMDSATNLTIYSTASYTAISATVPFTWASGDLIDFDVEWEVANWAPSVTLSTNELLLRKAKARYTTVAGQSIPNASATIIDYGTKDYDDLNSVTTGGSWKFTAPVTAKYEVTASIVLVSAAGWAATETLSLILYKNGSQHSIMVYEIVKNTATQEMAAYGTATVSLAAGDYIDVRAQQNSGGAILMYTGPGYNFVTVKAIQDESAYSLYEPYRRVVAKLNCDASSAITTQNGTWVSSIGNISGGECAVTLVTGIFSATPICSCSRAETAFTTGISVGCNATSATAVAIDAEDDAGSAATTFDVVLDCEGTPGSVRP